MTNDCAPILMYPARVRERDNPYVNTLVSALKRNGLPIQHYDPVKVVSGAAAVHVHWPERVFHNRLGKRFPFAAGFYAKQLIATLRSTRESGGRVIWTAHNLAPHDGFSAGQQRVWSNLRRDFFELVTDVATLSESGSDGVIQALPELGGARFHPVLHQHFVDVFDPLPKHDFRAARHIPQDAIVFASVGYIKPYKRIVELITAFKNADIPNSFLVIAGRVQSSYRTQIIKTIESAPNIIVLDGAINNTNLANVLRASNASVFNFTGQFNSGALITSLSIGTPVISPAFPAGAEIAGLVGGEWMLQFNKSLTEGDLVHAAALFGARKHDKRAGLSLPDPDAVAVRHRAVYGID